MRTIRDTLALEICPGATGDTWEILFARWNAATFQLERLTDHGSFDNLSRLLKSVTPVPGYVIGIHGMHRYALSRAEQCLREWLDRAPKGICRTFDDLAPQAQAVRWLLRPHRIDRAVVIERARGESVISEWQHSDENAPGSLYAWTTSTEVQSDTLPPEAIRSGCERFKRRPEAPLVCVGSMAGIQPCHIAEQLGASRVLIPDYAVHYQLVGMMASLWCFDFQRRYKSPAQVDLDALRSHFMQLMDEAMDRAGREGFDADDVACERTLEVSCGESLDRVVISCPAPSNEAAFSAELHRRIARSTEKANADPLWIHGIALRMRIDAAIENLPPPWKADRLFTVQSDYIPTSPVVGDVVDRARLIASGVCSGPVVLRDPFTDIVVSRGWTAEHSRAGGIWLQGVTARRP